MATNLKGEPNYKRKMWEWLEMKVEEDQNLIESEDDLTKL
jgi:hypothetical protein